MGRTDVFGTACKTCRRRGRKCDRSLPTCTSCIQRGVTCEGYNLRWVGLAARGRLAHQTDTTNQHPLAEGLCHPSKEETLEDGRVQNQLQTERHQNNIVSTTDSPQVAEDVADDIFAGAQQTGSQDMTVLRQQTWSLNRIMEIDPGNPQDLVQYYSQELGSAFYLGLGPVETPFSTHILSMTQTMSSVKCAVAALASCHIANRLGNDRLNRHSLKLRVEATQALRNDLKNSVPGPDLGSLACILLLAQLDLCSGDCVEFGTHLDAASKFVHSLGSDGTDRGFFEQRLVWLDILSATTTSRIPHWTPEEIKTTLNKFRTPRGRDWGFDVFYCPIDLFEYLADITMLYKMQPNIPRIDPDAVQKAIKLGNSLKSWTVSPCDSDPRYHITEIWRLGILLYLIRIFQIHESTFNTQGLMENILAHARAVPNRAGWSISISWPLFHFGLLLSRKENETKAWLRKELLMNFHNLGCYNLYRAVELLEHVWQLEDNESYDFFTFGFPQYKLVL